MTRGYCFIGLVGLLSVAGCEPPGTASAPRKTSSDDVIRDIGKAAETTVEFAHQTKEEFEEKLQARLKELDVRIAKLREKGHDLKGEAKDKWARSMADLEEKRDLAQVKLAEVRDSTAEAWEDLRKGAHVAWKEMENAFHEASQEF
jgi:hypothetical protein